MAILWRSDLTWPSTTSCGRRKVVGSPHSLPTNKRSGLRFTKLYYNSLLLIQFLIQNTKMSTFGCNYLRGALKHCTVGIWITSYLVSGIQMVRIFWLVLFIWIQDRTELRCLDVTETIQNIEPLTGHTFTIWKPEHNGMKNLPFEIWNHSKSGHFWCWFSNGKKSSFQMSNFWKVWLRPFYL